MDLSERRTLLRLVPVAFVSTLLPAQSQIPPALPGLREDGGDDLHLSESKKRQNAMVKADYDQNIKDARELIDVAKAFEEDLERDDKYILSLNSLKKLDEIDKLAKRIRGRMKHV
jgi:hypothetical protein